MGARSWRAYLPDLPGEAGSEVELSVEESHHVARVLRLGPDDPLRLFDGKGVEWEARIVVASAREVRARLERRCERRVEPPLSVVLFQGLCRADRLEYTIQKATEVGVGAIHPFRSRRSERRAPRPRQVERWQRIAMEATKQSGRRNVPVVEPLDELPAAGPGHPALLLDASSDTPSLARRLEAPPAGTVWLAAGPESGFDDGELERFRDQGWLATGLGPRTLRTETAGVVAATIVLHDWGDLGR
jgi:16S rRNA (uracil1498-N3)-methyltransferase